MKTNLLLFFSVIILSITSLAWMEEDFILSLSEKLEKHYKDYPQVKVHLFFNQDKYTSGDTAYYKARFVSDDLRPVTGKQLLVLDLVNSENDVVQQQNLTVSDGTGYNQLAISSELPAGAYTIRAYNSWMKNFDPDFIFSKRIIISGKNEFEPTGSLQVSLSFFPEGNHLIANVSNKVVVRVSKNGKSPGRILEGSTVITNFLTDEQGFGSFIFTPEYGRRYKAQLEGSSIDYTLPSAEEDGCVVLATATEETLRVLLTVPRKSSMRNQKLYLVMSAHGEIYFSAAFKFTDQEFIPVSIPRKNRPAGAAVISLFTAKGVPIVERLVYNDVSAEVQVRVAPVKNSYRPREKINLEIDVTDELGNPMRTDMVVSAVSQKIFPARAKRTFTDDLYLFSEFPDETFYIDRNNSGWQTSLDNFMIAQKWKRYNWQEVLSGSKKKLQYGFKTMLNLDGVATYKETGKPVPDSTLIMVYLQDHMIGYEARTRSNGRFDLPFLFDFWGRDQIFYILEANNKELKNTEIRLLRDSIPATEHLQFMESEKPDFYSEFTKQKNLINKSFNYFSAVNTTGKIELTNPNAALEDEVMGADVEVDVARYIVFPTMEDLIREVVPSLLHRKSGGKPIVRIVLSPAGPMPLGDPLYIVDGVMTKNTEYFLSLKPTDILTVKVVKDVAKLSHFGALGKNGMVFIQTKKPDPTKLMATSTTLPILGLSKPVDFKIPDYSVDAYRRERIPDFRSTLYWNPTVKTDATGKTILNFYASDDLGLIQIAVNGMTADGRPFSAETEVEVSLQSARK